MTRRELLLLLRRDVDEISRVAFGLPIVSLDAALFASVQLLNEHSEPPRHFEERLLLFKVLRFIQAALAGRSAPLDEQLSRALDSSTRSVVGRASGFSDLTRAAEDVLQAVGQARLDVSAEQPLRKAKSPKTLAALTATGGAVVAVQLAKKSKGKEHASVQELRNKSVDELRSRERDLREQLFKLRFQRATGRIENPMKVRKIRREIARIQGLLGQDAAAKRA